MLPLRICLEDFMSHRFTDIDCTQFRSVLVVGRNRNDPRKSMGVGKSNIFKAIEYVLFGETQVKLDKIIRHGCDRCRVIFEFEVFGQIYRIIRSRMRKGSKSELRMFQKNNDSWQDITQKTSTETEQELAGIVKISHLAFRSSILFAQADLHGLASVTPRERKAMLKEPLQISIYNKFEKIAKDKVSISLKNVERSRIIIDGLGDPKEDLVKLLEQRTQVQKLLFEHRLEHENLSSELEEVKINFVAAQKISIVDVDELHRQLVQIQQEKKKIQEKIKVAITYLNNNETKIESLSQEIIKDKDFLIKSEEDHQKLVLRIVRSKVDVNDDLSRMIKKEIDGKAYLSRLQSDRIKFSRPIPEGDMCDHCNQTVSEEHRQVCEEKRNQELSKIFSDLEKYTSILESVKLKRLHYELELSEIDTYQNSLSNLTNRISSKKNEIDQATKLFKQLAETIELRKTELKIHVDNESDLVLQESLIATQIEVQKKNTLLIKIEEIKNSLISLELKIKTLTLKISEFNINLGMIEEKISTKEKDRERMTILQNDLVVGEKELSMRLKVQQAFGSSGIPTMIINTILDDLQIITNDLLGQIHPGIEVVFLIAKTKLDGQQEDTLDIIYRINAIEYEYDQLSGGQKVIIALCFKLALSLVIQHRIGVDIKFLMLDEVDSQFDPNALEAFVNVIKKWQDKFTIFVITHNKDLKEKFTHAILVEGDEVNGAMGSLVNSW